MTTNILRAAALRALLNCLTLTLFLPLSAQTLIPPLDGPLLLSGNFGELRATHFHTGIDIKTGGAEGLPVRCVQDGILSRVLVSPTGYGHALYIDHPDGTTTVYAHLQRFEPRLAALVRQIQYTLQSFPIDTPMLPHNIRYRQGDTIAYSGNTGSSGGPHLHFEIRTTATEHPLNPLLFYPIRDTRPPLPKHLHLYAIHPDGRATHLRACPLTSTAPRRYSAGRHTLPAGHIGIALHLVDHMNDSWNKLGIYRLTLTLGTDTLYHLSADSLAFHHAPFIHEVKDHEAYKKRETTYRCFGPHQHRLLCVRTPGDGTLPLPQDSTLHPLLTLQDINGNRSTVTLTLRGGAPSPDTIPPHHLLRHDLPHLLHAGPWTLRLDPHSLPSSLPCDPRPHTDTLTGHPLLTLSPRDIPLLKKATLTLRGHFPPRALLCESAPDGTLRPLPTRHTPDSLTATLPSLSRHTLALDTLPPTVEYLGKGPSRTLRFRIKDDLSGIATYRGEVNGQWCLFSYDPRADLLQCRLDEPPFRRGTPNEVRITVTDKVNNRTQITKKITP